ncbi:TolC family protein [Variovorax guangxiensis]|nr:TolC family protein [Variovorax guangxiensis]
MHRHSLRSSIRARALGAALVFMGAVSAAHAQPTLAQAFDAAWARQPEAAALQVRRDAAQAQGRAARAWTPEPMALELSSRTDRWQGDDGVREREVGLAVPLWLPGERARSGALADAEAGAVESRVGAARLRVAEALREAHWTLQRSAVDVTLARDRQAAAQRLAADVARRLAAGDLARADQHQADGALAAADSSLAQALAVQVVARQKWRAVVGTAVAEPPADAVVAMEPAPPESAALDPDAHPALRDLQDRAAVAERAAALSSVRTRANPELTLATTRERDGRGEPALRTVTLGLRIPFGAGDRQAAVAANAHAEALDLQTQLSMERDRIAGERDAAHARVDAARAQLTAAERLARLAAESRGFFDKSFRLGETDLPTRLRIEGEAVEAQRQEARSRIDLAAAISHWRQSLGLLFE